MPDRQYKLDPKAWGEEPGTQLSPEEAAEILAQRLRLETYWYHGHHNGGRGIGVPELGVADPKQKALDVANLIDGIIASLPAEALTEDILKRMDLRPILQPLLTTEHQASQQGEVTINGQQFSPGARLLATTQFMDYKESLINRYSDQLTGTQVNAEDAAVLLNSLQNDWRGDLNNIAPEKQYEGTVAYNPTTGEAQTMGASDDLTGFLETLSRIGSSSSETALEAPPFLTRQDINLLARDATPGEFISRYMGDLSLRSQFEAAGGFSPSDPSVVSLHGAPRQGTPYLRPGADIEARRRAQFGPDAYTINQALDLPGNMTQQELTNLTKRMKEAGIFAQASGEPDVMGDPMDPKFRAGWWLLLQKSVRGNKGVYDTLEENALAYKEAIEENVRASLSDPATIRLMSDGLGRNLIGRKLRADEQAGLIRYIHDLQRKDSLQDRENPDATGDINELDWEARMQEWITSENPEEALAKDVANQFDSFRSLLGGPPGMPMLPGGR